MEDMDAVVTKALVQNSVARFVAEQLEANPIASEVEKHQLATAADIVLEMVTKRDFPEFITTHLYEHHAFQACHKG
ncbi:hypothetical protein PR048_019780 [Dryococelus australis]|uniref:Uncharacterized protein n=1 Tax=Dryococelus australis TaxID=614101 RepID=A0ABQ9H4H8_9NEOP|nr:hypothetical protein PR048_019780 [Dryococelus australis]